MWPGDSIYREKTKEKWHWMLLGDGAMALNTEAGRPTTEADSEEEIE